jgi:V/A-type H+-transporting ATPase subunit B
MSDLITRDYRTIRSVSGPLLFVERVSRVALGEIVRILLPSGEERRGQVIEVSEEHAEVPGGTTPSRGIAEVPGGTRPSRGIAVIQVLEETIGIGVEETWIRFTGEAAAIDLSRDMLGRRFDGAGRPIDGLPPVIPEARAAIGGAPINPVARDRPSDFIQTGVSTIDGLNTLVRGQKLPIFSGAGLPAKELAAQIVRQARVADGAGDDAFAEVSEGTRPSRGFAVVFAAVGVTFREASFFLEEFGTSAERTVVFLNLADDPAIERLMTPRLALTCAEFLAFGHGLHVLVVLLDMTNYCEALREIATARGEVPGRRGYPGYMYSDLATIYERAGRIKGRPGSITQLPILTMPDDDLTHPIPDLTGYITEGQLVLSRDLHHRGIYPPIDPLPSLSRLMNHGIGAGKTREDHREWADQLYALYAQGRDLRRMEAIVGKEGIGEADRPLVDFADRFERELIHQGREERSIAETLEIGWRLLGPVPRERLTRLSPEAIRRHRPGSGGGV